MAREVATGSSGASSGKSDGSGGRAKTAAVPGSDDKNVAGSGGGASALNDDHGADSQPDPHGTGEKADDKGADAPATQAKDDGRSGGSGKGGLDDDGRSGSGKSGSADDGRSDGSGKGSPSGDGRAKDGSANGQGGSGGNGPSQHSHHFAWADTATSTSGEDDGAAYTGPVTGLEHEYGWSGHDGKSVTSSSANVFIHGGDGDDAIAAVSGTNVLDGGAGSNFLTGAHGDDGGTDTFFVDVRGGQTVWDTVGNFHKGDAVTLWGFVGGVSSMKWSENEGAEGFRGATLHAETHGAGTGIDASVTFAGMSVAEASSKLHVSTGSVGGSSYVYLHHDG